MKMSKYLASAAVAAALCLPGVASALTFSGDWAVTGLQSSDPGLVVKTSGSAGSFSTADLAVGESYTFNLFRIWTDESSVNKHEDTVASPIEVTFSFAEPLASGPVSGTTRGVNHVLKQWGALDWNSPITLTFGEADTGRLSLALSDVIFNKGLFGLNDGYKHGANVTATLTYDAAPIPLPATLPLLLGGLALVGAARRRATARAAA